MTCSNWQNGECHKPGTSCNHGAVECKRCPHWDSGWCYRPETVYKNGCVGRDKCEYFGNKPIDKWANRFLQLAKTVAGWSKDPSTKVGAVAVDPNSNAVLETGFNGLPRKVVDLPDRMERPAKYLWTAHAEENLVAHAARKVLEGSTVYVTHLCCNNCARMLINAGVAKVVVGDGKTSMPPEQFEVAKTMFKESGVDLEMGHVLE